MHRDWDHQDHRHWGCRRPSQRLLISQHDPRREQMREVRPEWQYGSSDWPGMQMMADSVATAELPRPFVEGA